MSSYINKVFKLCKKKRNERWDFLKCYLLFIEKSWGRGELRKYKEKPPNTILEAFCFPYPCIYLQYTIMKPVYSLFNVLFYLKQLNWRKEVQSHLLGSEKY